MNHTSGPRDVVQTLDWFARAARPELPPSAVPDLHLDSRAEARSAWTETAEFEAGTVRALPLFADVPDAALELILASARAVEFGPGELVIGRWQGTREFYVIVVGGVQILGAEGPIAELGPGGYFGELAALDWGANFGYARTAEVVTTAPVRLLVLDPASLSELLRLAPGLEQTLRTMARSRLTRL